MNQVTTTSTPILNEALSIRDQSVLLKVTDQKSFSQATCLYAHARDWKKKIEARQKEFVAPLKKQIDHINDRCKELTEPLDTAIKEMNAKCGQFYLDVKGTVSEFAEDELCPDVKLKGEGATLTVKKEKKFRITDIEKVPRRYLTISEDAVLADLKLGVNEIPGLEAYVETTTTLRMK
jgi:hypothetical protein